MTDETRNARIIALYRQGLNTTQLGARFGLARDHVSAIVRRAKEQTDD